MRSLCLSLSKRLIALVLFTTAGSARELRICADPANIPFSNRSLEGFENRIADLLAQDFGSVTYVWQRMGRSFVREYINSSKCEMLIGVPKTFSPMLTTVPYYRSSYVFVLLRNQNSSGLTLNHPMLHNMKIGVQVLDDDYAPPARALASRGMQANVVGFRSTGTEAFSIIDAVARRKVDVAIVWGPLAGYFAMPLRQLLKLIPLEPEIDPPGLPFTFEISMGVAKGNGKLRDELNIFLNRRSKEIKSILHAYGVPQLPMISQRSELNR